MYYVLIQLGIPSQPSGGGGSAGSPLSGYPEHGTMAPASKAPLVLNSS